MGKRTGYTLVECVAAIVIIAAIIYGFASVQTNSYKFGIKADRYDEALKNTVALCNNAEDGSVTIKNEVYHTVIVDRGVYLFVVTSVDFEDRTIESSRYVFND